MHREIYLTSPLQKPNTISLPMIDFQICADEIDYQGCDTLMFTSKQAVQSAEEIDPKWKELPTIAIGKATANRIESFGGEVLYHPRSYYGKELANDILKHFSKRKVLYLRPKVVSFDSKSFLAQGGYELKEQIIYETLCKSYTSDQKPTPESTIIFTSPSTIHCFVDNFGWEDSWTAIVIGKATVEHLPQSAKYYISDTPLIDSCIEKALQITRF